MVDIMFDASQSSTNTQSSMLAIFHNTMCNTNLSLQLLGDFMLTNSRYTFNSANANATLCAVFDPVDDIIVENNEQFTFQTITFNPVDSFVNEMSLFQLVINDNDGKNFKLTND